MSTTTSDRFDPLEGVDYGKCVDCGRSLATADAAREHRSEKSHTTRGINPDRVSRIQSHVDYAIESAISGVLDELQGDVDQGDLTAEEVAEALRWHSDFADAWKEEN